MPVSRLPSVATTRRVQCRGNLLILAAPFPCAVSAGLAAITFEEIMGRAASDVCLFVLPGSAVSCKDRVRIRALTRRTVKVFDFSDAFRKIVHRRILTPAWSVAHQSTWTVCSRRIKGPPDKGAKHVRQRLSSGQFKRDMILS